MTGHAFLLFQLACWTAIIHALIPDHWLPFVLMARAQNWSNRRTLLLVSFAGFLHVLVSIAVAAIGMGLGAGSARYLAENFGRSLEFLAGILLVIFGLGYGILAHRREARAHGRDAEPGGNAEAGGRPLHAHGHLLGRWFHRAITGGALVVIIGISPCALLVPILLAASAQGAVPLIAAGTGFALCTIGTMVLVTFFASRGMSRIQLPFFTHYGDLISGLMIAIVGIVVILEEF